MSTITAVRPVRVASGIRELAAPEPSPADCLRNITGQQHQPGILVNAGKLAAAVAALPRGAKGISVPDVFEPDQISLPIYFGVTTTHAQSEVPHWHPEQAEVYVVCEGEAELVSRYRWDGEWRRRVVRPGDVLIVQPEVCHWFRWLSESEGYALVFKAPQRAGVGRSPCGKVTCRFCPHGCVPEGFTRTD
jgi:mannose-6-phosphate isomerase-like protein (cupin superfamily)